jgi:hypothetical protein
MVEYRGLGGMPMDDWIELDSLHVVSDLHLGGRAGFQIFGSTTELAWLIDRVRTLPQPGTHALLLNGDVIDFLAEEPGAHFDPDGAIAKLDGVWQRFEPVFAALHALLATADRLLIVNLGNHDLELALPWVRAHLTRRLTGGDAAARARLVWVTDGTGVRCRVGKTTVLCLHGNEVDSWNVTDFESLRRIGRDHQFGLPVEAWAPNAGTKMVIEVMNQIKRQYPFVDLLKPEAQGVVPVLAALKPDVNSKLLALAGIAARKVWDRARMSAGFLSEEGSDGQVSLGAPDASTRFPPPIYRPPATFGAPDPAQGGKALLAEVELAWGGGVAPMSLVRDIQGQQLSGLGAAWNALTGKPKHEVLREALEHLDRDRSFEPDESDDTFRDLDALVGTDIDLLLAGHTHLERSLPRGRGRGHYFNSGTWARLIRIKPEVRQNPAAFAGLFRLLDGGTIEALDKAHIKVGGADHPIVLRRNTVVVVEIEAAAAPASKVRASLQHVLPAEGGQPIRLELAKVEPWRGG